MSNYHDSDAESLVNQILSEPRQRVAIRAELAEQIARNAYAAPHTGSAGRAGLRAAAIVVASAITASTAVAGIMHLVHQEKQRPPTSSAVCTECEPQGATLSADSEGRAGGRDKAESPARDYQPTQQRRGDTTVLHSTAPRHAAGGTLVQDLSIGSESQGPNYLIDRIISVLGTRDGSIWLLDGPSSGIIGSYRIRKYDSNGKFIANVSRMGEGPGELNKPSGPLAELPDGRVAVRDPQKNKVDVFTPSGAISQTWTFGDTRLSYTIGGGNAMRIDTNGIVYLPTDIQQPDSLGFPSRESRQTVLVRLRKDGTIIDTLYRPALPQVAIPEARVDYPAANATRGGGGGGGGAGGGAGSGPGGPSRIFTIYTSVPFSPLSNWFASPLGYLVTVVGNRYAVDLRIPRAGSNAARAQPATWRDGDPVVSIRRSVTPVPVSAAERRDRRATIDSQMQVRPGGVVVKPLAEIPAAKPLIRGVAFGEDGRIWVLLSTPSERYNPAIHGESVGRAGRGGWLEPTLYDVFEPTGVYLGQVRIPYGMVLHNMRGDVVYASLTGDDGAQVARRYRINWK